MGGASLTCALNKNKKYRRLRIRRTAQTSGFTDLKRAFYSMGYYSMQTTYSKNLLFGPGVELLRTAALFYLRLKVEPEILNSKALNPFRTAVP